MKPWQKTALVVGSAIICSFGLYTYFYRTKKADTAVDALGRPSDEEFADRLQNSLCYLGSAHDVEPRPEERMLHRWLHSVEGPLSSRCRLLGAQWLVMFDRCQPFLDRF